MKYCQLLKDCISDGPGVRVSIYFSGCNLHCKGCHNAVAWDFNYGQEFTKDTINEIKEALNHKYISGLTIAGGEPLQQNKKALYKFVKEIKKEFPEKTIWLYTGYEWVQARKSKIMKFIDAVVVGPFILEKRDISCNNKWRGSTNQRVVNVKESLKQKKQINLLGISNNN